MKRITAIALTLAAVLGCSYVGSVSAASNAEYCAKAGEVASTTYDARAAGMRKDDVIAVVAAQQEQDLRQMGISITNMVYSAKLKDKAEIVSRVIALCQSTVEIK